MKLTKYTFRTPLFGSIDCEEVLSGTDGRIELSPEQMCKMYDKGSELLIFLSENADELSSCVPEELSSLILKAEFGDCALISGKMWLRTYIYTEDDVTDSGLEAIEEWITGQMSDGWGEGLEQKPWKTERVQKPVVYFDEYSLEFEEDEEFCQAYFYAHPWESKEFEIYLEDEEEVEEDMDLKVVATMDLPNCNRQVVKLPNRLALKMFLKDFGQESLLKNIEECYLISDCPVYLVRDFDKESGVEILSKWALEKSTFCSVYDMKDDIEVRGTQMPVSKAVLELLK